MNENLDIAKVAMVINGINNIGIMAASVLLKKNAQVIVVVNNEQELVIAQQQLKPIAGDRVTLLKTDLLMPDGVQQVLAVIEQQNHLINYLINGTGPFESQPLDCDDDVEKGPSIQINKAIFDITQAVVAKMNRYDGGNVVNLGWPVQSSAQPQQPSGYFLTKYPENTDLPAHTHPQGEEILVLDGVYSDELGHYGTGFYLRNPPASSHSPFSKEGCVMFVRMDQFNRQDQQQLSVNSKQIEWQPMTNNVQLKVLHQFSGESAVLLKYRQQDQFKPWLHFHGGEIFVIPQTLAKKYADVTEQETLILVKTNVDFSF